MTFIKPLIMFVLFFEIIYAEVDTANEGRKNILFLVADDMRPSLGCYSDCHHGFDSPVMHTPNLDSLSDKSILFERAYVQQALCSPSRTSLLTGRRPDTTRVTDLHHYFRDVGGNFTTIPQYFKEHGYYSVGMGKIFHIDDPLSWSEPLHRSPDYWHSNKYSWRALTPEQYNKHPPQDTMETEYAISKLRELAKGFQLTKKPFFLALGLHKPHLPFIFPEDFLSLYPEETIHIPDNSYAPVDMPNKAWSNFGELRYFADTSNDEMGINDLGQIGVTYPDYKVKELRRAYYAAVSYADYTLGQILNELSSLGLEKSTIVSFWSDHGWQLGEHTEWCKHTNFEVATHAPLMLRIPGLTDDGIRTSKLVEFVDLFPTLVEATGMDPLEVCPLNSNDVELCSEGSSLVPLIKDPENKNWKEAIFWQYPRNGNQARCMGYSIRTDTHHYTEWVHIKAHEDGVSYEPEWGRPCTHAELYNLKKDPKENRNVYNDPEYEEIILELSLRLRAGWRAEIIFEL